jgi:hypothetical protein
LFFSQYIKYLLYILGGGGLLFIRLDPAFLDPIESRIRKIRLEDPTDPSPPGAKSSRIQE